MRGAIPLHDQARVGSELEENRQRDGVGTLDHAFWTQEKLSIGLFGLSVGQGPPKPAVLAPCPNEQRHPSMKGEKQMAGHRSGNNLHMCTD